MPPEINLSDLVTEIKAISGNITAADEEHTKRLEGLETSLEANAGHFVKLDDGMKLFDKKFESLETSINDLWKRASRPGAEGRDEGNAKERAYAIEFLEMRHEERVRKKDADHPFTFTEEQVKDAIAYRKALTRAVNTVDANSLPQEIRKSLTAFALGSNGWVLAPEQSNRVISCIVDPTDLAGMMASMNISGPAVKFPIDNQRMGLAAWACEASCFANNPMPDLSEGLGELEIKPETIRYIVCVGRDLLEDAAINVEDWIMRKVSEGMRATINHAIIVGDGVGKPLGILHPNAGIPICETSPNTPPGMFTWQDLIQLKYELPMEWHTGASYLMNQRTFSLLHTMSDAIGRPLVSPIPQGPGFMLDGSPIRIASQMPDVAPGATPVAFGNWQRVYMVVWRKAITMQQDPYSAGFCVLYKFEARVGGGVLCPNAARLLRIR